MRKSEDVRERWLAIPDEFSLEGIIADSREEAERYAKDVICVVEKSAYDRLKAERDELVRKLADSEKACHELWESATDRDMSLIKERNKAVEALEIALDAMQTAANWGADPTSTAIAAGLEKAMAEIKALGIVPVSVEGGEASG